MIDIAVESLPGQPTELCKRVSCSYPRNSCLCVTAPVRLIDCAQKVLNVIQAAAEAWANRRPMRRSRDRRSVAETARCGLIFEIRRGFFCHNDTNYLIH